MPRKSDWQSALRSYLAASARRPFVYGRHDCATFVGGAVEAMTGTDPVAAYRGRYTTARGALRVTRRAGFASHIDYFATLFADTARPGPGDIAVVEGEDGPAVGIVQGTSIYAVGWAGMGILPLNMRLRAFEVPHV